MHGGEGGCMCGRGCVHDGGTCMPHTPLPPPDRYYGYGIRLISGRYASYRNAFLFLIIELHSYVNKFDF